MELAERKPAPAQIGEHQQLEQFDWRVATLGIPTRGRPMRWNGSSRLPCSDLVETDACRLHRLERFLLQLQRARALCWTREGTPGDRAVIVALGALQGLERRRMFVLPFEPFGEKPDRVRFRRGRVFDPEPIAVVFPDRVRNPLPVAFDRGEGEATIGDRHAFQQDGFFFTTRTSLD
jgi:hypothetical protein